MKYTKIAGIALGMSSSILGVAFLSFKLIDMGYITQTHSMLMILGVLFINLYWIIRYAIKKTS